MPVLYVLYNPCKYFLSTRTLSRSSYTVIYPVIRSRLRSARNLLSRIDFRFELAKRKLSQNLDKLSISAHRDYQGVARPTPPAAGEGVSEQESPLLRNYYRELVKTNESLVGGVFLGIEPFARAVCFLVQTVVLCK
jgi:hypothetical protein